MEEVTACFPSSGEVLPTQHVASMIIVTTGVLHLLQQMENMTTGITVNQPFAQLEQVVGKPWESPGTAGTNVLVARLESKDHRKDSPGNPAMAVTVLVLAVDVMMREIAATHVLQMEDVMPNTTDVVRTNKAHATLNHLADPVPECPLNVPRIVIHRSTVIRPGEITAIRCQILFCVLHWACQAPSINYFPASTGAERESDVSPLLLT